MFMVTFNAMMDGFAAQIDAQVGRKLFTYNNFGNIRRPHLRARPIEKVVNLAELASILGPLKATMPLGDEDFKAIRARTGFLPETLPEIEDAPDPEPTPEPIPSADQEDDNLDDEPMTDTQAVQESISRWREWALKHDPRTTAILAREVE